jgi:hypothetical protein
MAAPKIAKRVIGLGDISDMTGGLEYMARRLIGQSQCNK